MKVKSSTGLYCLIGNPLEKSLSPDIHNTSFDINKVDAVYTALEVKPEYLEDAVKGIKALNIKGFNVTIPHKVEIIPYLDELDREANLLGAVNTVKNVNGRLKGYNTDGKGFIELLKSKRVKVKNQKVIVIGAGGAARAIAMSLAIEGVKEILIVNRTIEKARTLSDEIKDKVKDITVKYSLKSEKEYAEYDLIINCTSIGMYPDAESVPFDLSLLSKSCTVADIVYKPLKTKFLQLAESRGHQTVEGLGMLINQALLSEEIWLDKTIEKELVLKELVKGF